MAIDTNADYLIAGFLTGDMVALESERIILATIAAPISNACLPKFLPLLLNGFTVLRGSGLKSTSPEDQLSSVVKPTDLSVGS